MNIKMNMNNDQDNQEQEQEQGQKQGQGREHIIKASQEQEQESRLFTPPIPSILPISPGQLQEAWTKFLLEVICEMEKAGLIKRITPESEDKNDECEYLKKNPNRIRIVGPIWRRTRKFGYKRVPFIRLSGSWLEKCGFAVGQRFLVYPTKDQLLLKKCTLCSDWLLLYERTTRKKKKRTKKKNRV